MSPPGPTEGVNRHLAQRVVTPSKRLLRAAPAMMETRLRSVGGSGGGDLDRINGPQLVITSRAFPSLLPSPPPPSNSPPPPYSCIKDLPGLSLPTTCHTRSHRPPSILSHSQRHCTSLSCLPGTHIIVTFFFPSKHSIISHFRPVGLVIALLIPSYDLNLTLKHLCSCELVCQV